VIATAAGGPLEIVRSEVDGVLVPPRQPQALANAVRLVQQRREEIVRSARTRVEAEFDIRAVVPRIEAFYRALMESAKSRH
jgi:glycosyltransferase involved in cell wall biosynthesis